MSQSIYTFVLNGYKYELLETDCDIVLKKDRRTYRRSAANELVRILVDRIKYLEYDLAQANKQILCLVFCLESGIESFRQIPIETETETVN